jgi:hypothetical protein
MKIKYIYLVILTAILFITASCEKSAVQIIDSKPTGALLRVFNFALNGPSVNFYVNDFKISATSSTTGIEATSGVNYGGIFPANNSYISSPSSGSVSIKTFVPSTSTTNAGVNIANIAVTVEEGKYYSFYTSGIYDATAKTTTGFIVEDIIPAVDTSSAYVRIVNAIPNTGITGFDLKAVNTTTSAAVVIAAPIAYKTASEFVKVPNGVYNLTSVSTNTPTSYTITRSAVSFSKGFVYTITTKGDATLSTGTNARALDLTRNR